MLYVSRLLEEGKITDYAIETNISGGKEQASTSVLMRICDKSYMSFYVPAVGGNIGYYNAPHSDELTRLTICVAVHLNRIRMDADRTLCRDCAGTRETGNGD